MFPVLGPDDPSLRKERTTETYFSGFPSHHPPGKKIWKNLHLLCMNEIRSHHFEIMGSRCSLVFTLGNRLIPGFLNGAKGVAQPSTPRARLPSLKKSSHEPRGFDSNLLCLLDRGARGLSGVRFADTSGSTEVRAKAVRTVLWGSNFSFSFSRSPS